MASDVAARAFSEKFGAVSFSPFTEFGNALNQYMKENYVVFVRSSSNRSTNAVLRYEWVHYKCSRRVRQLALKDEITVFSELHHNTYSYIAQLPLSVKLSKNSMNCAVEMREPWMIAFPSYAQLARGQGSVRSSNAIALQTDIDAEKPLDWHLLMNDENGTHMPFGSASANTFLVQGRTKDVILIERVQRAATKMVAGLKSMDYETRLVVLDLFPLEYRRLRGDLILTYALFEQGLANRFFTVDPANTRRGHVCRVAAHAHDDDTTTSSTIQRHQGQNPVDQRTGRKAVPNARRVPPIIRFMLSDLCYL
ncbi:pol-related protein [Clonorchis sinensis]|uniref:Pol-related protein n=1 Tax=Clonorchis sinensis TaxID=79923 RepID=G7YFA0_CLOSI|nr:pol-related protein [Clonorchis sinensis]